MSTTLNDSVRGDVRNALILARACELAYCGEPEGPARFKAELGLDAQLISVDNTQVYLAENADSIMIAFRGSEAPTTLDGLKDWLLTNANNYLILPEGRSRYRLRGRWCGCTIPQGLSRGSGDNLATFANRSDRSDQDDGTLGLDHGP